MVFKKTITYIMGKLMQKGSTSRLHVNKYGNVVRMEYPTAFISPKGW